MTTLKLDTFQCNQLMFAMRLYIAHVSVHEEYEPALERQIHSAENIRDQIKPTITESAGRET